jgi:hypothetical protein
MNYSREVRKWTRAAAYVAKGSYGSEGLIQDQASENARKIHCARKI